MKRIGLLGGTFNPVHCGHMALARWLVADGRFDEVRMLLSPQNPLKEEKHPGATDRDRMTMLELACEGEPHIRPDFTEFDMPRPSYSINTLRRLAGEYPDCRFSLIIGTDNWLLFDKWRQPDEILRDYGVVVYPRPGHPMSNEGVPGMTYAADAPVADISSTMIRTAPARHADMLPEAVAEYIIDNNLYADTTE